MTLDEYTAAILPIIRLARAEDRDASIVASHTHYLYNQALYGFEQFGRKIASKKAQAEYEYLGRKGRITQWAGKEQKQFDPKGKQNGVFHLDHVYTLSMMRRAIEEIPDHTLNVESIAQIVRDNYCVAWILKSENTKLNQMGYRSRRGRNLHDALEVYRQVGIELLNGA